MVPDCPSMKVWLVISSFRNDAEVIRILHQVQSAGCPGLDRVLVVDSEATDTIPAFLAHHGWDHVLYRAYPRNLGSGANLRERLRIAADGGADYAYALNHDGNFDPEVMRALLQAAQTLGNLGAVYPLGYVTLAHRFNLTGTRELPLPALLVPAPPSSPLLDVFWSSSNGALYSTVPVKQGILPWSEMWMGWEDLEYGWRLADRGYRQVMVCSAIYRDNYEYKQTWLGKVIDKPVARTYCSFRNLLLAIRRSRNRPLFYGAAFYRVLLELAVTALLRDQKLARFRGLCQGLRDGFTEDLVLDSISDEAWQTCFPSSRVAGIGEK